MNRVNVPNPYTNEALAAGCICYEEFFCGAFRYAYFSTCPVHGKESGFMPEDDWHTAADLARIMEMRDMVEDWT